VTDLTIVSVRDEYHQRHPSTRTIAQAGVTVEAMGGQVLGTRTRREGGQWIVRTEYLAADCESCLLHPATAKIEDTHVCEGCTP
jgi:hypothetical protein